MSYLTELNNLMKADNIVLEIHQKRTMLNWQL